MVIIPITLNKYIIHEDLNDLVEMILIHERLGEVSCFIDLEDVEKCRGISWSYNAQNNYVQGNSNGNKYSLQRFIMNTPKDQITDHIDGNTMNNRKSNLRFVTPLQSQYNTSRIGVNFRKDIKKYRAYIVIDKKTINLGVFNTYEEACRAREQAEIKYFGEYRRKSKFDFLK